MVVHAHNIALTLYVQKYILMSVYSNHELFNLAIPRYFDPFTKGKIMLHAYFRNFSIKSYTNFRNRFMQNKEIYAYNIKGKYSVIFF